MDRRQLLKYLGSLAAASTLSGCGTAEVLHLQALAGSLPPQAIGRFRRQLRGPGDVRVSTLPQLADLFEHLERTADGTAASEPPLWRRLFNRGSKTLPELVALGDAWLSEAIARELLQPFDADLLTVGEMGLPARWEALLRRNAAGLPATEGQIWGLPYRWGVAAVAYRRDKLAWQPRSWNDLLHPDLREYLSLPDSPRLAIGLALKALGATFNHPSPQTVPGLATKLAELHQQAKYYSSLNYLQPLVLGDTWAAVGWSADVLPVVRQYPKIVAFVPVEGTALWADLWVRPRSADPSLSGLAREWLEFCWQPEVSSLLTRFAAGTSPVDFPEISLDELSAGADVLQHSEFLFPLSEAAGADYRSLWETMRRGNL